DAPGPFLRKKLWEPLLPYVKDAGVVLLSPDGPLHRLPFAALPGARPGTVLLEEMPVAVMPVPRLLTDLLTRSKVKTAASLLLGGDVDSDDAELGVPAVGGRLAARGERAGSSLKWQTLPGTRGEIQAVGDSFTKRHRGGQLTELRRKQATEAALRQHAGKHRW